MNIKILFAGISFLYMVLVAQAQVTIGSNIVPSTGALLDLKEYNDAIALSGGRTTTKGLGLPRVKLVRLQSEDISETINDVTPGSYTGNYTGMLVYHLSGEPNEICAAIPSGLYVWDGDKWQNLRESSLDSVETYTDQEGNEFFARHFGAAGTWMIQNLGVKHYARADGTADTDNPISPTYQGIPNDGLYTPYFSYPNPDENGSIPLGSIPYDVAPSTWSREQGLLYNWSAATKSRAGNDTNPVDLNEEGQGGVNEENAENVQGICPKGWHLPTDREWNKLEKELTENASIYSTSTANSVWDPNWETTTMHDYIGTHGIVMKSQCPLIGSIDPSGGNSLSIWQEGFNAILLGTIDISYPGAYGKEAYFWTASMDSSINPWHRTLRYNEDGMKRASWAYTRSLMSVRCKKN